MSAKLKKKSLVKAISDWELKDNRFLSASEWLNIHVFLPFLLKSCEIKQQEMLLAFTNP